MTSAPTAEPGSQRNQLLAQAINGLTIGEALSLLGDAIVHVVTQQNVVSCGPDEVNQMLNDLMHTIKRDVLHRQSLHQHPLKSTGQQNG